MEEILLKFKQLSSFHQKELLDFLDFLLKRQEERPITPFQQYKEQIMQVSTWSEEEIAVFEENRKAFNQWQTPDW